MTSLRPTQRPGFVWQAGLILLPVLIIAVVALTAIIENRTVVGRDARRRAEEVARAAFGVFSSRAKGSFAHACAVLQRLVQAQPEPLGRWLARDSQRFVGAMLPYLHHPPVASTFLPACLPACRAAPSPCASLV